MNQLEENGGFIERDRISDRNNLAWIKCVSLFPKATH